MAIQFHCQQCHKEIRAPDEAAGKKGKCPHCQSTNRIPDPAADEDIPLAPLDEEEEQRLAEEVQRLREQERALLEAGAEQQVPSEQKEETDPEDLYHHVVNYCVEMSESNLDKAEASAKRLQQFGYTGLQAVDDFLTGKAEEPTLDKLPPKLRKAFLEELRKQLR